MAVSQSLNLCDDWHLAGHEITLLTFCQAKPPEDVLNNLGKYCRIELVVHDTNNKALSPAINLFSPVPYTISKYISSSLSLKMRQLLERERYDIVQLENLHMAHYYFISRNEFHIPTVLRQHNLESLLAERYAASQKGLLKLYIQIHTAKLKKYELKMCSRMDLCLTITQEDAEKLHRLNRNIQTFVVPAGVDTGFYFPDLSLEKNYTIVSIGSMDWPPNVDALLWFAEKFSLLFKKHFHRFNSISSVKTLQKRYRDWHKLIKSLLLDLLTM